MIKKAITCLLIMMMTMMILETQFASSIVQHITGANYSYVQYQSNPALYFPRFVECYHTTYPGNSDNTEVGIGVKALYYSPDYFNYAWWDFNAQYGNGDVAMIPGLIIDPCVNGNDHHYYAYYGQPYWTTPPTPPGWPGDPYQCWYVHYEIDPGGIPVFIGYKSSVEGSVTALFYRPSDPPWPPNFGPCWQLDAYTQNPYNPNDPNGWSYLHAWYGV
ncbi:MAG: hypothetical protein ACPLKZ_02940 [Candidatus Bathyarchaeales archaeon]